MYRTLKTSMSGMFNYFLINSFNIKVVKDCNIFNTTPFATGMYLQLLSFKSTLCFLPAAVVNELLLLF